MYINYCVFASDQRPIVPVDRSLGMFQFVPLDLSTLIDGLVLAIVLGFLRFGNSIIDLLLSYRSSPVDTVEKSLIDQD